MLTPKGQARREEILDTTRDVLFRSGYDGVSLRDIANRLNMKLGNLQYYFATREDLFVALIEREGEKDVETVRDHLAAHDDPQIAFERIAQDLLLRWGGQSAVVYLLVLVLRAHRPAFEGLYTKIYRQHYEAFCGLIARIRPDLDESATLRKAQIVTSLLDGALLQMIADVDKDSFNNELIREARALIQK